MPTTPTTTTLQVHHWSDSYLSLPLHSTFVFLHSTLLITLSLHPTSPPPLPSPSLTFYSPSPIPPSADPTSTTSLGLPPSSFSTSLSSRLSRLLHCHVLAFAQLTASPSSPLPQADAQLWLERRVLQELQQCKARGLWPHPIQ